MKKPESELLNDVDALVASHLAGQAARVDAEAGLARVRAGLNDLPTPARRRPWLRVALSAAMAAAVVFAFLGGRYVGPAQAGARELVQEAQRVHGLALERCYLVEMHPLAADEATGGKPPRQVRVWTAGNHFWAQTEHVDPQGAEARSTPFVWGRSENGALWAALDPHRGVRVMGENAPRSLNVMADLYGLNVDTLLHQVLKDCTLSEATIDSARLTRVIMAEPTTERMKLWLNKATLEIDTESRVLRRLILDRSRFGKPFAQVVCTLVDTRPREDSQYQLEGHLRKPFEIYDSNIPPRIKLELVSRWLGWNTSGTNGKAASVEKDMATEFVDLDGKSHNPLGKSDRKATVLLFLMTDCPISNAYAPEIKRICAEYEAKRIAFFVVHGDPDVTVADAKKHAQSFGLTCPVLLDPHHRLVKSTGVTIAPEVAVVGPAQKVLYRGRIDDWYFGYGKRRAQPTRRDLRLALDAIVRDEPVAEPVTKAIGCYLPDPKK